MKKLLVVTPYSNGSGNKTTIDRICGYLDKSFQITIIDALNPPKVLHNKSYDFGLLLHAYKSGRVWLSFNLDIPYVLIYGGTDLNENISNSQDKTIIDALTLGAAHRICFSKDFDIICNKLWKRKYSVLKIPMQNIRIWMLKLSADNERLGSKHSFRSMGVASLRYILYNSLCNLNKRFVTIIYIYHNYLICNNLSLNHRN